MQDHAGIDEDAHVGRRVRDAHVPRPGRPPALVFLEEVAQVEALAEAAHQVGGRVHRAVVDHYDLELL